MQKYTERHRLSPGRCFFAFGNSQRCSLLVHGENTVKYCSSGAVLLRAAYGYYNYTKGGVWRMPKLGRREQTVINYMKNGGNMKKAMIDAGYSETYADRNSQNLMGIIGDDIKAMQDDIRSSEVKSVEEIQKWWSDNMDNDELTWSERIKISELLARSQGGFLDKIQLDGKVKLEDLL